MLRGYSRFSSCDVCIDEGLSFSCDVKPYAGIVSQKGMDGLGQQMLICVSISRQ